MNKRIKELKNQTLDKHFSYTWSKMDYDDVTKFAEKFALLIVRECADVAKETRWAVPPSQEQIARGIQQHFGVEE